MITRIILAWWREIAIVLTVITALGYVRHLQLKCEWQQETIVQLKEANGVLTEGNKTLTATVQANNKTIGMLGDESQRTKDDFNKLAGVVQQQTRDLTQHLKDILMKPVPASCDDTIEYMINNVPKGSTK